MAVIIYSQESAEELLRAIIDARNDELNKFFQLTTTGLGEGQEIVLPPVEVQEVRDQQFLSNGHSVVHCKTRYGRKVDIYLPPPGDQSTGIAEILIEEDDIPTGS